MISSKEVPHTYEEDNINITPSCHIFMQAVLFYVVSYRIDYDWWGALCLLIYLFFISFSEKLIEAIHNDIKVAKNELDKKEFTSFQNDKFFMSGVMENSSDVKNGEWSYYFLNIWM